MSNTIRSAFILGIFGIINPILANGQEVIWPTLKCEVTSSQFVKSPFPPLVKDTILFQAWNDQQIELIFEPSVVNPESNINYVVTPQPLQLTVDKANPVPTRKWSTQFQDQNITVLQELTLSMINQKVIGRFEQIETRMENAETKKSIDSFDLSCE